MNHEEAWSPKVLHLVPNARRGGIHNTLVDVVGGLNEELGHQTVGLVSYRGKIAHEFEDVGATVEVLGHSGFLAMPRTVLRLRKLLLKGNFEVVHSHRPLSQMVAALATIGTSVAHVATFHGSVVRGKQTKKSWGSFRFTLAERMTFLLVDQAIFVGQANRDVWVSAYPAVGKKSHVIYNPFDLSRLRSKVADKATRDAHGVGEQDFLIVNVGRLAPEKQQTDIAPLVAELRSRNVAAKALILGEGLFRKEVEASIADAGMAEHVRLLGARTDVADFLNAADLYVSTSVSEGLSVAVVEAMALRCPGVVSDIAPNQELAGGGARLLVAKVGNPSDFADQVESALAKPEETDERAALAQEWVVQAFSKEETVGRLVEVYRSAAHRRSRSER